MATNKYSRYILSLISGIILVSCHHESRFKAPGSFTASEDPMTGDVTVTAITCTTTGDNVSCLFNNITQSEIGTFTGTCSAGMTIVEVDSDELAGGCQDHGDQINITCTDTTTGVLMNNVGINPVICH